MTQLVPNRLLFDFEFPLRYRKSIPVFRRGLFGWTDEYRLPDLGTIDGQTRFGDLWASWNEEGLTMACRVTGKTKEPVCKPQAFWRADNLRVCLDTRDARGIQRATEFCHHLYFLPCGAGKAGKDPVAGSAPFNRARKQAPVIPPGRIAIDASVRSDGYEFQATVPSDELHGWDPEEHPRIGFYYILEDGESGQQYLTVGDDLNWHINPSTWATAVLAR